MTRELAAAFTTFKAGSCRTLSRESKSWGRVRAERVQRTGLKKEETSLTSRDHLVLLNLKGNSERGDYCLDGKPAGKPAKLHLVSSQPADNLNLGANAGSLVGDYDNPLPFVGKLEDVRLYWGTLRSKLIPAWSKPPGE